MKFVIILCLHYISLAYSNNNETVIQYLVKYGFLKNENNSLQDSSVVKNAISLFQEYYNFPIDGEINDEMEKLINKPRCGVADLNAYLPLTQPPWKKFNLSWHYSLGTPEMMAVARESFHVWAKHSNLSFYHDPVKPDILISNKVFKHRFEKRKEFCYNEFDGKGGTLAHAYFPNEKNTVVEIHIDFSEDWDFTINSSDSSRLTLLSTMIHEIGHSLGIEHTKETDSVMYPFHNGVIDLSDEDISLIQGMYGEPSNGTIQVDNPMPTTPAPPPVENSNDLCKVSTEIFFKLVIINSKLYVLKGKLAWIFNIEDHNSLDQYTKPLVITDWLKFLPSNIKEINAVYQRPSGEVVIIVNNVVYMFDIQTQRLSSGFPKSIGSLGLQSNTVVHGIFNSYRGRTYLLYDKVYYVEIDECYFSAKSHGYVSDLFVGVPTEVESVLRYTNGLLYFIKNNLFYEYNEFTKKMKKAGPVNLNMFGLSCYTNIIKKEFNYFLSKYNVYPK